MTQEFYPMTVDQWVTAGQIAGLEKRVAELTALLAIAEISPDTDPQEIRNRQIEREALWFEKEARLERLTAEVERLQNKIIAAGYKPESSVQEIQKSKEALDHLVKYQASEAKEILAENERLREALSEYSEALGDEDE